MVTYSKVGKRNKRIYNRKRHRKAEGNKSHQEKREIHVQESEQIDNETGKGESLEMIIKLRYNRWYKMMTGDDT